MNPVGHGLKAVFFWLVLLGLSLYVFNDWKNDTLRNDARIRFYDKAEGIFNRVYYSLEDDIEGITEENLEAEVNKILDYIMLEKDPDWRALSEEEKENFVFNMVSMTRIVALANKKHLPPPAVIVPHDFAEKIGGN